jgi:hypothetical protein
LGFVARASPFAGEKNASAVSFRRVPFDVEFSGDFSVPEHQQSSAEQQSHKAGDHHAISERHKSAERGDSPTRK